MPFIAYKITHRESGRAYVGVTTKSLAFRWARHIALAGRKGHDNALARAILKYGPDAFDLCEMAYATSKEDMMDLERILIVQENVRPPFGFNLTGGGEGVFDPSPEVRKRLSVAGTGRKLSDAAKAKIAAYSPQRLTLEVRERISKALTGRKRLSPTTDKMTAAICRLNISRTGIPLSAEHRMAISVAQTGMKRPIGTGEKIAATKRGKPRSDETKAKISATRIARYGNTRPGWPVRDVI